MNELESPLKVATDTELVALVNKEYTLKGSMRKQRGMILFEVDPFNEISEPVKIQTKAVLHTDFDKEKKQKADYVVSKENKAYYKQGMVYVWAINAERALYKAKRDIQRVMEKLARQKT